MADVQAHSAPGDLSALQSEHNKSEANSPVKQRRSAYYPRRGVQAVEDSNTDPFYLKHTLMDTAAWDDPCQKPGQRDVQFCEAGNNQYFTLSSSNDRKGLPCPNPVRREPLRPRANTNTNCTNTNRTTLSVVELEHQLGLQQIVARKGLEQQPVHCKKGSFSSGHSETTPDLTPSSSFSSNFSAPVYPESVVKAADRHVSFEPQRVISESGSHLYLTPCTPPPIHSQSALSTTRPPPTPTRNKKTSERPSNDSCETITTMHSEEPPVRYNRRGKPLPTLPNIRNSHPKKSNAQNGNQRTQIQPSMISPPSLINPVTMEPHTSHFDQAFFIPANDCPSPVPSPGPVSSSPFTRELTADPPTRDKQRPVTAEPYCEQSVWESDSDSESVGPKSLSKKPIDTLRKVRSRVHLRVARSAPRLNGAPSLPSHPSPHPDGAPLEKFPSMPDPVQQPPRSAPPPPVPPGPPPKKTVVQARSSRDVFRPSAQGTLRLVAPSTTSLVRPDSKQSNPPTQTPPITPVPAPQTTEYDIDRPTEAAALQAQSRRKQRADSPPSAPPSRPPPAPTLHPSPSPARPTAHDRERLRTLCREERTENTLHNSLALGRRPLYRRFWESLRVLSCHNDMASKPTRKSF